MTRHRVDRASLRRLWRRKTVRLAAAGVVLLALLWAGAASGVGMRLVTRAALNRTAPDGWTAQVATVRGNWLSRVSLRGLEWTGPGVSITVDSVGARYALSSLLRRTVRLSRVYVAQPRVEMDLAAHRAAAPSDTPAATPARAQSWDDLLELSGLVRLVGTEPLGRWRVRIDFIHLWGAESRVQLVGDEGQNVHTVAGGRAMASIDVGPDRTWISLDSLTAEVTPPGDSLNDGQAHPPGRLALGGTLADGVLTVTRLAFHTRRSRVDGSGSIALLPADRLTDRIDFDLAATPLDLRDLPLDLPPSVREEPELTLSLAAKGAADSVRIDGRTRGPSTVETDVAMVLRPFERESNGAADSTESTTAVLSGSATVRGAELLGWVPPPFDGTVDGTINVRLTNFAMDSPLHASGTVTHTPRSDTTTGLASKPMRAEFRADREAGGTADIELSINRALASGGRGNADPRWTELGRVVARIGEADATWSVSARIDSAAIRGNGSAAWADGARQVTAGAVVFENVDANQLDPSLPVTSVTGNASGHITGWGEQADATVRVALGRSSTGGVVVDTLAVDARVRSRVATGSISTVAAGNRAEANYSVTLGDTVIRGDLTALRLIQPEDTTGASAFEARGRASGSWALRDSTRRGSLRLALDSVRAGGVDVRTVTLGAEIAGERVTARARADVWGSPAMAALVEARLDASGSVGAELGGTLEVTALRPHAPAPPAERAGGDLADDTAAISESVSIANLVAGAERVDSLVGRVAFRGGQFDVEAELHPAESGRIGANGSGMVTADSTSFVIQARGTVPEPTNLLQEWVVDSLEVVGSGRRVATGAGGFAARIDLTGGRRRGVSIGTVHASVRRDSTGLLVDTLIVDSNTLIVSGSGMLPSGAGRSGRMEVTATVVDLEPLRRLIDAEVLASGSADLRLVATGNLDSIEVTATGSADAIAYEALGLTGLDLDGRARLRSPYDRFLGLTTARIDVALDRIALPEAEVRRVDVRLTGTPDSLSLETSALVDDRRRADIVIAVDPRPDRRTVRFDRVDVGLDRDRWSLTRPATLWYGDGVTVDAFVLRASAQELRIEGGFDGDGTLDLLAQMDSTDIGTLSDLAGFRGLEGWIGGSVRVGGSTTAPVGRADLTGAFHRAGVPPHPARINLESDGRRVITDVALEDARGGALRLAGSAPVPVGAHRDTASVDLVLTAQSFGLAWALPFLDPTVVSQLRGRIDGRLTVQGTLDQPSFGGTLALRDGAMGIVPLGTQWTDVYGVVRGRGADLAVDSVRIVSGAGNMTATGGLSLTEGLPLAFDIRLDRFQAIRNEQYRSTVSGALQAGGTLERPELTGALTLQSLDVFLDERVTAEGLEEVELTEADLQMLRERFGYVVEDDEPERPLLDRITADLIVTLGRDSWLRKRQSPEMAVAFTGAVNVSLRPGQEPILSGSVETIEGRGFVTQFGRRFRLREGTVTFDGPSTTAQLDLAAEYSIPSRDNPDDAEATVVLAITGTQESLALTLSSDPPMEAADIVSYIATGRPASGTLSFGQTGSQGGLVEAGADMALGQIVGVIEGAAERKVGLDVVEFRREGLRGATLVAGKYLSPRLYVGFAQPIHLRDGELSATGRAGSEVEVEVEALRWLLINIEGSGSALRFFLRGRRAY